MKVLYITSKGGIHDYRFLKKLVEDYEVMLLHYAADKLIPEIKEVKGLNIISKVPLKKSFPLLSEYGHFKRVVNDFMPDIIHSGYVWQVGVLPAYMDFHPHLSMAWGSDILTEPDESLLIKHLVKKVMLQSDHIQCDADFVKAKIMSDYSVAADKITVFPWGIDLGLFSPLDKANCRNTLNLDPGKFIVIFNRHLDVVYGVSYMLEGFKKFSNNKNDVELLMLSDGILKEETLKYIADNNLSGKIKMIGRVPNSSLPLYLNASDVYVSTSLSDGTSLSLLEAMACGPGLVLSDVPAIKEWVNETNGILVPRKDPDATASALNKYYADRNMIAGHGKKNRVVASQRADWDKNYSELKKIYSNLLKIN